MYTTLPVHACSSVVTLPSSVPSTDSHRSQPHGISSQPSFIGSSTSAPSTVGQSLGSDHHARAVAEPIYSIYTYNCNLQEYAFVSINGHASSTQGEPLLYLGEEITGFVVFPAYRLHEVRSIVVAVSWFLGSKWLSLNQYS